MADLRNLGGGMPELVQETTVTVPRACPYTEPLSVPICSVLSLVLLFVGWKVWSRMVDVQLWNGTVWINQRPVHLVFCCGKDDFCN